jgi:hypothetical protein
MVVPQVGPQNATDQQARMNEPRSGKTMLRALLHPLVMWILWGVGVIIDADQRCICVYFNLGV